MSNQAAIRIGNEITKAASEAMTERIISLYKAASDLRISDDVLKHSITALSELTDISDITIQNCSFVSGAKVEDKPLPEAEPFGDEDC